MFLTALIPIVGAVILLVTYYKLAKYFGHGTGFAVLTIFFSFVCFSVLAFEQEGESKALAIAVPVVFSALTALASILLKNQIAAVDPSLLETASILSLTQI